MNEFYVPVIDGISPGAGVESGKVYLKCPGYEPAMFAETVLKFNGETARLSAAGPGLIAAPIPAEASSGSVVLEVSGVMSNEINFTIAHKLATNLHPVANPAFDREGNIYVTLSGMRGEEVPISIYKVSGEGSIVPFARNILNPTGIAINHDGEVFVSNRNDGTVHKVSPSGNHVVFADGLGVCTGIVFDRDENLYVGDREGTIYKLDSRGKKEDFAKLPPSPAAFHMALGPDGCLYATGPTLSGYDHVYKIDHSGQVSLFCSELGRPQGLAFDSQGNLHLVGYLGSKGGIIKITPEGSALHEIAGVNLVGLAFDGLGNMIITSVSSVYKLYVGDNGLRLS